MPFESSGKHRYSSLTISEDLNALGKLFILFYTVECRMHAVVAAESQTFGRDVFLSIYYNLNSSVPMLKYTTSFRDTPCQTC